MHKTLLMGLILSHTYSVMANRVGFDGRRHEYKAADETGHHSELSTPNSSIYSPYSFTRPQIHKLYILSHLVLRQDPSTFTSLTITQQELAGGGNGSSPWVHAPVRSAEFTANIPHLVTSTCHTRHVRPHAVYMVYSHFFFSFEE